MVGVFPGHRVLVLGGDGVWVFVDDVDGTFLVLRVTLAHLGDRIF